MSSHIIEGDVKIISDKQIKTVNEIVNNFEYYKNKCFKSIMIYINNEKIKTKYEDLGILKKWNVSSYKKNSKNKINVRKYKLYFLDNNNNKKKKIFFSNTKLLLIDCSLIENDSKGGKYKKSKKIIKKYKNTTKKMKNK